MAFDENEIQQIYGRRAGNYDVTANLYYLLGFREQAYRKRAVRALGLQPGGVVVEIGCGTGLNFTLLQDQIGPVGRIVGVDLTQAMLEKARRRSRRKGWKNVELVHSSAAQFNYPGTVNGIISTFAMTLIPEYDSVIRRGVACLAPGGRIAILDFKAPMGWPAWLIQLWLGITRPFAVTLDLAERRPYESVQRWCQGASLEEFYSGLAYLSVGERRAKAGER